MKIILTCSLNVVTVFVVFQEDIQILKMNGDRIAVVNLYCGNQPVFICEKYVSDVIVYYTYSGAFQSLDIK